MLPDRRAKSALLGGVIAAVLGIGLMKVDLPSRTVRDRGNDQTEAVDSPADVSVAGAKNNFPHKPEPTETLNATAQFARAKVDALLKAQKSAPSGGAIKSVQAPAEQALQRLVQVRQCEKLAGALNRKTLSSAAAARCPVNHPEALEHAGGYAQVLVDQTVMELAFLRELALAARANRLNDPFDVARIAKVYVNHSDDNVREQALALAEILPDTEARVAMEIAAKALVSTVSGPLSTQALDLLARHRHVDSAMADRAVVRALKESGWDVKDAVASQSLPFLTAENRPEFLKIMNSEPERSRLRLHLRLNLEEFDRTNRL